MPRRRPPPLGMLLWLSLPPGVRSFLGLLLLAWVLWGR